MGLAPTYGQIGIAAPILLVVARLIQGFSCGGEWGPPRHLLESAAPAKRVGMAAWQAYGQLLALLSGSLAGVVITNVLSEEQLYAWGWRLPFLLGILIAPVGLYIRRQLPETIQPGETHTSARAILAELARHHARSVLFGVLVICGGTVATYVLRTMTTFAITTLHLSPAVGTTLTMMGYVAQLLGGVVGVWADRFGRKTLLVALRLVFAAAIYPAFVILTSPESSIVALFVVYMALSAVFSMGLVPVYAFLLEAFPKAVRSSGLSILYALGTTIFGGTTQFVVAWLIERTGSPMVPAWYMLATTIAATIGVLGLMPHPEVVRERPSARTRLTALVQISSLIVNDSAESAAGRGLTALAALGALPAGLTLVFAAFVAAVRFTGAAAFFLAFFSAFFRRAAVRSARAAAFL